MENPPTWKPALIFGFANSWSWRDPSAGQWLSPLRGNAIDAIMQPTWSPNLAVHVIYETGVSTFCWKKGWGRLTATIAHDCLSLQYILTRNNFNQGSARLPSWRARRCSKVLTCAYFDSVCHWRHRCSAIMGMTPLQAVCSVCIKKLLQRPLPFPQRRSQSLFKDLAVNLQL